MPESLKLKRGGSTPTMPFLLSNIQSFTHNEITISNKIPAINGSCLIGEEAFKEISDILAMNHGAGLPRKRSLAFTRIAIVIRNNPIIASRGNAASTSKLKGLCSPK